MAPVLEHWEEELQTVPFGLFRIGGKRKGGVFSIVTESMWKQLRRELIIKMQIDVPGTGIAFIVPVSSIGGKKCCSI